MPSMTTASARLEPSSRPRARANSSLWPLPAMPAMATTSPPRTSRLTSLRRDAERDRRTAGRARSSDSRTVPMLARLARDLQHLAADHQAGERAGRLLRRVGLGDHLAAPHDGGVVADALHLLQAVADVEHRAALAGQPLQGDEQVVGLLRGQHRGRLVHDQELRLLQQAADDLDALALAHREVGDDGVRRAAAGRSRPTRCSMVSPRPRRIALGKRERDVLGDGERLEQREVLEHHADAETAGGGRAGDGDRLALPADLALGRLQRAVDDLDQRRLAGAVLAEQRVDFAGHDGEVDAVVGPQRAEVLGDADRLERRLPVGLRKFVLASTTPAPVSIKRAVASRWRRVPLPVAWTVPLPCSASSRTSSSATVAAAITAGALELMPATPIGQTSSAMRSGATPASASRFSKRARLVVEPISPT